VCQAIGLASEVLASRSAWRQGMFRQAVTEKQWGWEGTGVWRWEGIARQFGPISPGSV